MTDDTKITPEWCLNIARLEEGHEIGAGPLDHPLRQPMTNDTNAGYRAGIEAAAKVAEEHASELWDGWDIARFIRRLTPTAREATAIGAGEALRQAVEPWSDYHGDLPDYDHPLRCVFESGVQYTVELLAKELNVEDWTPCDGTEEYDGDLGGTLMNIVLAAMPKDEHGDPFHPKYDLPGLLSASPKVASDTDTAIPAGMKAWVGGSDAPADWDGGEVLGDDSQMYGPENLMWQPGLRERGIAVDIVAYTPKPDTDTPVDPGVEGVTQADRDAASAYLLAVKGYDVGGAIREGRSDHTVTIQAFARHRLASTPANTAQDYRDGVAYQVIGSLADQAGLYAHPSVVKAMDYFSGGSVDPLPFEIAPASPAQVASAPDRAGVDVGEDTALGEVQCHCSEDDGIPDVGVSLGLGDGCALWIGELLKRDGGDIGIVFHGPNGQRIAAPLWPNCEWQDAADILRHHVGPILAAHRSTGIPVNLAALSATPSREGEVELPADVRRLVIAARYVTDQGHTDDVHADLLDAVEAFADRVPYDDEPSGDDDAVTYNPNAGRGCE